MSPVIISNVVSYNSTARFGGGGLISGIPGQSIEDVKINEVYMEHVGGGTAGMAAMNPPESKKRFPKPTMFGPLPASGFFVRHAQNIEFTNVELAWTQPDARPAFWLQDIDGTDLFRIKTPKVQTSPLFSLHDVQDFQVAASWNIKDVRLDRIDKSSGSSRRRCGDYFQFLKKAWNAESTLCLRLGS